MKTNQRTIVGIIGACAALLVAGGLGLMFWNPGGDAPPATGGATASEAVESKTPRVSDSAPTGLTGGAYAFDVALASRVHLDTHQTLQRMDGSLLVRGTLTLQPAPGGWRLAVTSVDDAQQTLLGQSVPITLEGTAAVVETDGHFVVQVSADADAGFVRLAEALGSELAALTADAGATERIGRALLGSVTDHYQRSADRIVRTDRTYESVAGAERFGAATRTVDSKLEARLGEGVVLSLRTDETVQVAPTSGPGGMHHTTRIVLDRTGDAPTLASAEPLRPIDDTHRRVPTRVATWRTLADGMSTRAMSAAVRGRVPGRDVAPLLKQAHGVVMLEPEASAALADIALDRAVAPAVRDLAVDILVDAGHGPAQTALRRVFAAGLGSGEVRMRFQRLVRIDAPEVATLTMAETLTRADDALSRKAAMPVYGALIGRTDDPALVTAFADRVIDDTEERQSWLAGLGNTRSAAALPALLAGVESSALDEKRAAVRALAHYRATAVLLEVLRTDRRVGVQLDASESLKRQKNAAAVLSGLSQVLDAGGMNSAAFERWVAYLERQTREGHRELVAQVAGKMRSRKRAPPEVRSKLRFIEAVAR